MEDDFPIRKRRHVGVRKLTPTYMHCITLQLTRLRYRVWVVRQKQCLNPIRRSMVIQQIWTILMIKENSCCRVCGYELSEPPWGEDGQSPSWDICPCCGTEFGYNDCTLASVQKNRGEWILNGKKWFDKTKKPEDWNFDAQQANIPEEWKRGT